MINTWDYFMYCTNVLMKNVGVLTWIADILGERWQSSRGALWDSKIPSLWLEKKYEQLQLSNFQLWSSPVPLMTIIYSQNLLYKSLNMSVGVIRGLDNYQRPSSVLFAATWRKVLSELCCLTQTCNTFELDWLLFSMPLTFTLVLQACLINN